MKALDLSSPWIMFYRELEALFKEDPTVRPQYDEAEFGRTIRLYVDDPEKAEALSKLLPSEKTFGNVTVRIIVVPANTEVESLLNLFRKAFKGNPALACIHEASGVFDFNYVVFQAKVVQFESDNIGDINGLTSTLYQDIAKDVFEDVSGIFFCTEKETTNG